MNQNIRKAAEFIIARARSEPRIGIILGTGLGALAERIEKSTAIPYQDIPHFPVSTVESHRGQLVFGLLAGRPVAAMEGRFHFYEGYSLAQVTFPVRILKALGARELIVSNACGALNLSFRKGDLMVIDDHINLMGVNPLIGPNDESLGPRFPDMSEPYDRELQKVCLKAALEEDICVHRGVYLGVTGPNLETRAEYRMLRGLGADVVGMSTVPEVIVAVHAGLRVLGISCITDLCDPDHLRPVDIAEIIRVAQEVEPKLTRLIERTVSQISV
ncbi:MAG: purine-nucleoside phosphorylase [Candidatus Omnitrophica bacterium]|nr:purine-nucleoside phosphorylase [Candidatus Omnitrophota bacterium]